MTHPIATMTGIALVPGVSRNRRWYKPDLIPKIVERAQARIAAGEMPLTMLTHHAAGDDSTEIVGSLTEMTLTDDGRARFTAEIADTPAARTILNLTGGERPHLRNVSIRGAWVGTVRRERGPDGEMVETADDLELDGLDFTKTPGVAGAAIDSVTPTGSSPAETSDGRTLIYETAEELVTTLTETAPATPAEPARFADPGYLSDRTRRLPIDTLEMARAAWNQLAEATGYSAAQRKRIRGRIAKALGEHGVTITENRWLIDPVTENGGEFHLCASAGPISVSVSSYSVDPADLEVVLHAAVAGAAQCLQALDVDVQAPRAGLAAPYEDDEDSGMSETTASPLPAAPADGTQTPAADEPTGPTESAPATAADHLTQEEPPMESTPAVASPATENTATLEPEAPAVPAGSVNVVLTDQQFQLLLNRTAPTAPAPVAAETAQETAPAAALAAPAAPVTETEEQRIGRLVAEGVRAALPLAVQEMAQAQPPARKGLIAPVTESAGAKATGLPEGAPAKPLHEYSNEEWRQHIAPTVVGAIIGNR